MTELVIFDMDGLLIDTEPYWQETERKVFAEFGIEISEDMQHATFGLRTDEQIQYWYLRHPWTEPDFKAVEKKYNALIMDFFLHEASLMPGAEYILEFTKNAGIPMALASSSGMGLIRAFVERFQFETYFSLLYSAEVEEYGKPHPAVYLSTAAKMNAHPTRCIAFEDSLNGVIAAKAAKMKTVAVPDPKHFDFPGYGIADLKLKSLLEFDAIKFQQLSY